jgi:hypothetical protein
MITYVDDLKPKGNIFFTSCDSKYFLAHSVAYVSSCNVNKQDCHIHIINPTLECKRLYKFVKKKISINYTVSYEQYTPELDWNNLNNDYYYYNRFLVAPEIFNNNIDTMAITDIDILLINRLPKFKDNINLRAEISGKKGLEGFKAGLSVFNQSESARQFLTDVKDTILGDKLCYKSDQWALIKVGNKTKNIGKLNNTHISWNFDDKLPAEWLELWTFSKNGIREAIRDPVNLPYNTFKKHKKNPSLHIITLKGITSTVHEKNNIKEREISMSAIHRKKIDLTYEAIKRMFEKRLKENNEYNI